MKRGFFLFTVLLITAVMASLNSTILPISKSARGGQAIGATASPDIAVSHHDRVYTADQFSNTISVTDPIEAI
jgi:DNA-binding beta-propeller fold protein YncE